MARVAHNLFRVMYVSKEKFSMDVIHTKNDAILSGCILFDTGLDSWAKRHASEILTASTLK